MNGRVYDPVIGRFLSPDPIIQAPYNSQSYNRYSYVWNNPLSNTDPSGFVMNRGDSGGCSTGTEDGCSNRVKFEMERCRRQGLECNVGMGGQGRMVVFGTTHSLVTLATARSAGVRAGYVKPASLAYAHNGEPDNIRETAIDTELGLEMENGKLTGEIVWGCGKAQMAQCQKIVKQFDAMVANSEFLNITNSLVVEGSISAEANIIFFNNSSTDLGGRWNNRTKVLWYNIAYGVNKRTSWHEYGHAIGLYHLENASRNFMSYHYGSNVIYQLGGHQQYWLEQAYTPWYGGFLEWFD